MNLKNSAPYLSFIKISRWHFTKSFIITGFFYSILISNFIFVLNFENLFLEFISPFFAIYGLYKLIFAKTKIWFFTGFFIGLFWFYWISFSCVYYDLIWLIPFEIFGISLFYAFIFLICGVFKNPILRAFFLFLTIFIHPFGFNWFNLNLILLPGIFEPNFSGICAVLITILAYKYFKEFKLFAFLFLIFGFQFSQHDENLIPFKINLQNTQVKQSNKWDPKYTQYIIFDVFSRINNAIKNKDEIIIFPENALPIILNEENEILEILQNFSNKISIIIGALSYENKTYQNSIYVFENGKMQKFNKSFLVPFGEEIPLPKFARDFINKIFFNGADDFASSRKINDLFVKNIAVRGAICYEITKEEIYKNNPKIIIAITNNAWFMPSSEPILQKAMIEYFATLYKTTIYHSVNGSKSAIITPKKMWFKKLLSKF